VLFRELRSFKPLVHVQKIARRHATAVYLVGGAIRDCLHGGTVLHDCDFVVTSDVREFAVTFAQAVKGTVIPWDQNQVRVVFKHGEQHICFDFSRMHGNCIEDDLIRRDFTINACAVAVDDLWACTEPNIIDPCGGRRDLENGRIVCCGPTCFVDDPVRMLRGVRLARELSFSLDPSVFAAMTSHADRIAAASRERIKREFFLVLGAGNAYQSLQELHQTGLLEYIIPDIKEFYFVRQSPPHCDTLFHHQMKTVRHVDILRGEGYQRFGQYAATIRDYAARFVEEGVSRESLLVFTALLHDSGKVKTAQIKNDRITFYGHELHGSLINKRIARQIGLGHTAQKIIEKLTLSHMRLLQLCLLDKVTERAGIRLIRDCEDVFWELLILSCADSLATGREEEQTGIQHTIMALALQLAQRRTSAAYVTHAQPLLTGHDIQQILGIPEGPEIGAILAELHKREQQGLCETRQDALLWLQSKKRQP